jgi:hypothetical protein
MLNTSLQSLYLKAGIHLTRTQYRKVRSKRLPLGTDTHFASNMLLD